MDDLSDMHLCGFFVPLILGNRSMLYTILPRCPVCPICEEPLQELTLLIRNPCHPCTACAHSNLHAVIAKEQQKSKYA